jgi:hypothetical protein
MRRRKAENPQAKEASDPDPLNQTRRFAPSLLEYVGIDARVPPERLLECDRNTQPIDLDPPQGSGVPHANDLQALLAYSEM